MNQRGKKNMMVLVLLATTMLSPDDHTAFSWPPRNAQIKGWSGWEWTDWKGVGSCACDYPTPPPHTHFQKRAKVKMSMEGRTEVKAAAFCATKSHSPSPPPPLPQIAK